MKISMEVDDDYEYASEEEYVDGDLLTLDQLLGDLWFYIARVISYI